MSGNFQTTRKRTAIELATDNDETDYSFPERKKARHLTAKSFIPDKKHGVAKKQTQLSALFQPQGGSFAPQQQANYLQKIIRDAAQTTFDCLGSGFSESVYRDALVVELQHRKIDVWSDREVILPVHHRGRYVGFSRSDIVLLCSEKIINLDNNNSQNETEDDESSMSDSEIFGERLLRSSDKPRSSVRKNARPVVIELKAISGGLNAANVQQLGAYMRILNAKYGVLINFVQGDADLQKNLLKIRDSSCNQNYNGCLLVPKTEKNKITQTFFVNLVDEQTLCRTEEIDE